MNNKIFALVDCNNFYASCERVFNPELEGKPKGQGKYGESTKAVRIPMSKVDYVSKIINKGLYEIPLYGNKVAAGFPSPADDYLEDKIDLNKYLVKHPSSTFLVRASGESMINAGIFPNDILVVDRSLKAEDAKVEY